MNRLVVNFRYIFTYIYTYIQSSYYHNCCFITWFQPNQHSRIFPKSEHPRFHPHQVTKGYCPDRDARPTWHPKSMPSGAGGCFFWVKGRPGTWSLYVPWSRLLRFFWDKRDLPPLITESLFHGYIYINPYY